jgi:hypothetical protein
MVQGEHDAHSSCNKSMPARRLISDGRNGKLVSCSVAGNAAGKRNATTYYDKRAL